MKKLKFRWKNNYCFLKKHRVGSVIPLPTTEFMAYNHFFDPQRHGYLGHFPNLKAAHNAVEESIAKWLDEAGLEAKEEG